MFTIIIFLIVLAVLIFVHELGHFIFARWNNIRVDEFKIGFGPKLIYWGKGETKYGLNLIPFGGFVKIHGENPEIDERITPEEIKSAQVAGSGFEVGLKSENKIDNLDRERSFVNKKKWQQVVVLAAGVFFNFLFAWFIYIFIFTYGVTATTNGFEKHADKFTNKRTMITAVSVGSPAEKAKLKIGDVVKGISGVSIRTIQANQIIKAVDSKDTASPNDNSTSSRIMIPSVTDIQDTINHSEGKAVSLTYARGDSAGTTIQITPEKGIVADKYAIGIAMNEVGDLRLPFFTSIYEGGVYTIGMIRETAVGLYDFLANILHGTANFSDVSGPIGIAGIVGDAASLGFTYLLMITAIISINLGVINLVPFPALDGGRILFVIIEGITRKSIPIRFANAINTIGFFLLMALMVIVTYKDILKIFD